MVGNTGLNTQKYENLNAKEVTFKAHALCLHTFNDTQDLVDLLEDPGLKGQNDMTSKGGRERHYTM